MCVTLVNVSQSQAVDAQQAKHDSKAAGLYSSLHHMAGERRLTHTTYTEAQAQAGQHKPFALSQDKAGFR